MFYVPLCGTVNAQLISSRVPRTRERRAFIAGTPLEGLLLWCSPSLLPLLPQVSQLNTGEPVACFKVRRPSELEWREKDNSFARLLCGEYWCELISIDWWHERLVEAFWMPPVLEWLHEWQVKEFYYLHWSHEWLLEAFWLWSRLVAWLVGCSKRVDWQLISIGLHEWVIACSKRSDGRSLLTHGWLAVIAFRPLISIGCMNGFCLFVSLLNV